jgi:GNAT superfamily N-acetyltransferase
MIEVTMAEGEVDAVLAFRAYSRMYEEGGIPGTFSAVKTLTNILRFIKGPDTVVLLAIDGDLVAGVLTLAKESFWFSEDGCFIGDKGLYVLPEYRNGETIKALLEAAKTVSEDTGLMVLITINNEKRKRGGRSEWERIGATLGYINRGATLAHTPET